MRPQVSDNAEWYIVETSPSACPPRQKPVRFGPFMSEGECRTVLDGLKQINRFDRSIFELELHDDNRREKRFKVAHPVRLCEAGTNHSLQIARTIDVSISGVRLGGLQTRLVPGAVYNLCHGDREAPFQAVWVGSGRIADEAGMECLAPELNIWELDLPQHTEEEWFLREIGRARTVQSRLFPQEMPPLRTLDYCGHCIQARTVGGDYYDFLAIRPGEVTFVMADVSGKGIAAALLMANFHGGLHAQSISAHEELPRLLAAVNRHLYRHTDSDRYISVFLGSYSDHTRTLRYINCGHTPPLWLHHNGAVERFGPTGTVIGLFSEWTGSVGKVQIEPGDIVSIHTDGITEAQNQQGKEFGDAQLVSALSEDRTLTAASLLQKVERAVAEFRCGEQHDDATVVILRSR